MDIYYERVTEITEPSVSSVLFDLFGSDLEKATLDQKLVLMEVIAYSLREGGSFRETVLATLSGSGRPDMPEICTTVAIQTDEAVQVMNILYPAIIKGCSVI